MPGFALLAYTLTSGAAIVDTGMNALTDAEFSQRNSHYIFSEQYKLLSAYAGAATITRLNISSPTWNGLTKMNVWPINTSLTVPSPPNVDNELVYPPLIPMNEEIQPLVTDTNASGEQINLLMWIAATDWNQNLPQGIGPVPIIDCRVTASITAVVGAWSAVAALTFEQTPKGGVYAVVGQEWWGANLLAVRMIFPVSQIYNGRRLRPGVLASNSVGGIPPNYGASQQFVWGQHGRFSTFEPPQIEAIGVAAGAITCEGRLWLVRISDGISVSY